MHSTCHYEELGKDGSHESVPLATIIPLLISGRCLKWTESLCPHKIRKLKPLCGIKRWRPVGGD